MTDGHIQFTGSKWAFFTSKQEGLPCETPDCSTCKSRSKQYDDEQAGLDQASKDAQAAEVKARVDAQVEQAKVDADNSRLAKAGALKSQAVRNANLTKDNAQKDAEGVYAMELGKAQADFEKARDAANAKFQGIVADIVAKQQEALAEAMSHDWLIEADKAD